MPLDGIVLTLVIGLVAGLVARAVIPGKQDWGILATVALGLAGSVVGHLLVALVRGEAVRLGVGGWWASILGATLVLAVVVLLAPKRRRRSTRR